MSDGDRKTPSEADGPNAQPDARFYRIAEIHDRIRREAGDADTIRVSWRPGREPRPFVPADPPDPAPGAAWPVRRLPGKSLRPLAGYGSPDAGEGRGAVFVALFGLNAAQARSTVARIERQIRPTQGTRPVFLTDLSDTQVFRHGGFTYEYFPPHVFADEAQASLFAHRFRTLWRKWNGAMLIDFSVSGYLARRLDDLETYVGPEWFEADRFDPRVLRPPAQPAPVTDVIALRAETEAAGLDAVPDTFVLYRILGNDLPPRHEVGQTLSNLRFILDNEPEFEACEKRWVVNRIVDSAQEEAILSLLHERGQSCLRIPFDLAAYGRVGWDLDRFPDDAFFLRGRYGKMTDYDRARAEAHLRRLKNNYVINNNGARNAALADGRARAKWVLPWDGNCFLTEGAWSEIATAVRARPYLKYFTVPMARTTDNAQLLGPSYRPEADSEPQILFRTDAAETFDEAHYYGRRPKVELFYRLGVPGPWDRFYDDVWDLPRPDLSPDAGAVGQAGWVARLFSGQGRLETESGATLRARGEARIEAITGMLDRLDVEAMRLVYRPENLTCYDDDAIACLGTAPEDTPEARLRDRLILEADLALRRGPHSVVHKTDLPPSGDPHDYYHPSPYWWPDPASPDGYPHVFRDGERVPGTRLYEPQSDRFDRTRLQLMFDDTTTLALAWRATGEETYARHAAMLVRTFFLDPETAMAPHLTYAQVRGRWPDDTGSKTGLIETKDLYYLLDALRLLERAGVLSEEDRAGLRSWLSAHLDWLQSSDPGREERLSPNNHGTFYDLQTAAIAAFLGDAALLGRIFLTSRERMLEQFTPEGQQPHEMGRTQTAHYCLFNLQGWAHLARLAQSCGHDLWSSEAQDGRGLARAAAWLLTHMAEPVWPFEQIEPFDRGRILPLVFAAREVAGQGQGSQVRFADAMSGDPLFFPHDGIMPFWMLGQKPRRIAPGPSRDALAEGLSAIGPAVPDLLGAGAPDSAAPPDPADLEARLWGGFPDDALEALRGLARDATLPPGARGRASRALAKWAVSRGDFKVALVYLDDVRPATPTEARSHLIARAAGLVATGAVAEAEALVRDRLARAPHDPDACLLMANIERARPGADAAWTGWFNTLYRRAGLDGLRETRDGTVGWRWPGTEDRASHPAGAGEASPRVSIILTPPAGAACGETTLTSARSQSWDNLEILVVDRSGDTGVAAGLADRARRDTRIVVLTLPPGTSEAAARNAALARATGDVVTRLDPGECAHPMRTELQVVALGEAGVTASLSRRVWMTAEGEVLLGWTDAPTLLLDNPASLMIATATLRSLGGWEGFGGDPDAILSLRLDGAGLLGEARLVCPDTPLSLCIRNGAGGAALFGPRRHGAVRDAALMLRHLSGAHLPCDSAVAGSLATVYVGDFAAGAPGLDHLSGLIAAEADTGARVGIFHWPDYAHDWMAGPDAWLLDLVAAGRVVWVHADAEVRAARVVLCHTHMIGHRIDGLPDFGAERVDVLVAPHLREPVPRRPDARRPPDIGTVARLFACPAHWTTI